MYISSYKDTPNILKTRHISEKFAFFYKKPSFFFANSKKSCTFAAANRDVDVPRAH